MTQIADDPKPATDHTLILSSRVIGTAVFDRAGNQLGHVDDLSIDKASGRVLYAIMSFGGFLGIGERFHPVPWALLDYAPGRGGFVVPLDRNILKDAPNYDAVELRNLGGPSYRSYSDIIFGYYGAPPW